MVRKPNAFGWGGEKQNPQPPLTNLGRPVWRVDPSYSATQKWGSGYLIFFPLQVGSHSSVWVNTPDKFQLIKNWSPLFSV